jgi:hypothetical protein
VIKVAIMAFCVLSTILVLPIAIVLDVLDQRHG